MTDHRRPIVLEVKSMRTMTCIEDLRQTARRKVPRAFFDYAEAGSYSQATLRANREDLERIKLRQRVLVDVSQRDLTTTIMGEKVALPLALAPIGLCGMQYGDGEILACRAAQAAGIPFTLSTMSICSIEDVAQAVDKPFWFQLYVMKDRGFIRALIQRANAHRGPSGARPTPLRCPQRHDRAAADQVRQRHRYRDQTGMGAIGPA